MATRSRRRSRRGSASRTPLVVGGLLIVLVALGVAVFAGGGDTEATGFDLASVSQPTIEGTPVPTGATGVAAPYVRADALLSEGQNELPIEGEATMVVFLAHWCRFCNAEVPVINAWLEEDGLPDGVEVRAVATGIDPGQPNFPPDQWLRELGWMVPTVVDADNSIAAAYGLESYPYWVFVDREGIVVGSGSAQSQEALAQIAAQLATE